MKNGLYPPIEKKRDNGSYLVIGEFTFILTCSPGPIEFHALW
jgi:hypothetical protein